MAETNGQQDNLSRLDRIELSVTVDEIGGKLDRLIHAVDTDHREFHARLSSLEDKQ